MTIEEAIYSRLSGYSGLSALVSDRIYPLLKEQDGALPCVSFRRISTTRHPCFGVDSNVLTARFEISCWADDYDGARAVAAQVIEAVNRWDTTSGITVFDTYVISEVDLFADDSEQRHVAIDIEINYSA